MGHLFDKPSNEGWWDRYVAVGKEHNCVQSSCRNPTTGGAIETQGGFVYACSKHKEVAGGKRPKNVLREAEKAKERKLAAEARRKQKESNNK